MRSGPLDRRIVIQALAPTVDDGMRTKAGGWVKVAELAAALVPLTGAERIAAGEKAAFQTQKFRVRRYASVPISTLNRILYGGRAYDIAEVQEVARDAYDLIGTARSDDPPDGEE